MGTRSSIPGVVAILVVMGFSSLVFAGPVFIYSGKFDLPIPAPDDPESEYGRGWMADAIVEVPHHFVIDDLNVRINLTHTKAFDLQIFLKSPAGSRICLSIFDPFKEFFHGEDYLETIFDDEAETPIKQGKPPFRGRFRPVDLYTLSEFDGQDAYGTWRLQIRDEYYDHTGNLKSFELIITVPEPATAIFLTLGAAVPVLLRRRCNALG